MIIIKTTLSIVVTAMAVFIAACDSLSPQATEQLVENSPAVMASATPTGIITPTQVTVSGTISIWHSWKDEQLPALLNQIAAFQGEHPGVQFDVTYIPSIDLRASYEQAALNGRAPDLLLAPAEWGAALYDQGIVADVSSLVGDELIGSINPAAFEASRYRDAITGLPVHIFGNVLYRNRKIIPTAPFSFDELVSFAQAASQRETFGALLDRGLFFSGGHLEGIGGKLMNPDGSAAFNNEKGLAWVQLLQEFEKAGPTEFAEENDIQLFLESRLGLMIESSHRSQDLAEAIGVENLAIDPWPIYQEGTLSGFVQSENVYLNPQSLEEEQMVTWKFVQSLFTPEAQAGLAQVSLIPVLLPSRMISAGGEGQIADALIPQVMEALSGGATYPARPEMAIYTPYLDIALQSIFNGEASPAEALQTAADSIMAELAMLPTPLP
jgi:maltose-binding protein MalE